MNDQPNPKRVGPAEAPSLTVGDTRIDVINWGRNDGFGQNGGILRAVNTNTHATLWTIKVYSITYDPALESDVQDIFITSLRKAWFGNKLLITDDHGQKYSVDLATRAVSGE